MLNGWLKLYRALLDSKLWSCSDGTLRIAFYVLLSANHKTGWVRRKEVKPGQLVRSQRQIAEACRCSRKTVRYALDILRADEFLTTEDAFGAKQSLLITICKWELYQHDNEEQGPSRGQAGAKQGPSKSHKQEGKKGRMKEEDPPLSPQGADGPVPPVPEKPKKKKKAPGELSELDRQVAEIWKAYPKKAGKPEGTEAIRKALKKETFEFLLEKTVAYAAAVKLWPRGDNPQFVKHPQGWFNRERYHDDPAVWKRKNDDWY